jgi:hypothetical protein
MNVPMFMYVVLQTGFLRCQAVYRMILENK